MPSHHAAQVPNPTRGRLERVHCPFRSVTHPGDTRSNWTETSLIAALRAQRTSTQATLHRCLMLGLGTPL
jgi:hypothetical protein